MKIVSNGVKLRIREMADFDVSSSWAALKDYATGSLKKAPLSELVTILKGKKYKKFIPASQRDFSSRSKYGRIKREKDGLQYMRHVRILHIRKSEEAIDLMMKRGEIANPPGKQVPAELLTEYVVADEKTAQQGKKKILPNTADNDSIASMFKDRLKQGDKSQTQNNENKEKSQDQSGRTSKNKQEFENTPSPTPNESGIKFGNKQESEKAPCQFFQPLNEKKIEVKNGISRHESDRSNQQPDGRTANPKLVNAASKQFCKKGNNLGHLDETILSDHEESFEDDGSYQFVKSDASTESDKPPLKRKLLLSDCNDSCPKQQMLSLETANSQFITPHTNSITFRTVTSNVDNLIKEQSSKADKAQKASKPSTTVKEILPSEVVSCELSDPETVEMLPVGSSCTCCHLILEEVRHLASEVASLKGLLRENTMGTSSTVVGSSNEGVWWPIRNAVYLDMDAPVETPADMVYCGQKARALAVKAIDTVIMSSSLLLRGKVSSLAGLMFPDTLHLMRLRKENNLDESPLFPEDSKHAILNLINIGLRRKARPNEEFEEVTYAEIGDRLSKHLNRLRKPPMSKESAQKHQ